MKYAESELQIACFRWFRYQHAYLTRLFFAIPNGGYRNAREAGRLKAEGMTAGTSDTFLSAARNGYHGLYIEFKAGKNKETEEQKQFGLQVTMEGYQYVVCRSLEQFMEAINQYLK